MKLMYVYILKCSDGTFYTGVTNNLNRRFKEHESALHENSYSARRLPLELVYYTEIYGPLTAIKKEKQIKKWSQAKKLALIEGRYEDLPNLAKKKRVHFDNLSASLDTSAALPTRTDASLNAIK